MILFSTLYWHSFNNTVEKVWIGVTGLDEIFPNCECAPFDNLRHFVEQIAESDE
jgi:hypothetical protein